jgi:hypothetical protein
MNDFFYFTDAISKLFDLENMRLISGTSDRNTMNARGLSCVTYTPPFMLRTNWQISM